MNKFRVLSVLMVLALVAAAAAFANVPAAHASSLCSPGQYYHFGSGCQQSSPGTYAPGDDFYYPCPAGLWSGYGYSSCVPADPGYYVTGSPETPCPAGTYNPVSGATDPSACLQVPAGTYSSQGAAAATPCNYGYYQPNTGQSSCIPAPAGYFVNVFGAIAPTACAAGFYQPGSGQDHCIPSPSGNFVPSSGMTYYVFCNPGTYQPLIGQDHCNLATAGHYVSIAAATAQTPCALGSYQNLSGAASCFLAQPGHYVDTTAAIAQTPCAAGTYQPNSGQASCNQASAGNFVASAGSIAQTQCALGSYQPNTGAVSCLQAGAGFYVDTVGASSESACPAGQTSPVGSDSSSDCYTPDTTAPTITLTTPANGAVYLLNQSVNAAFSCQDEAGGSGLASCVGTLANGAAIDTSSVGARSFSVNASDNAGNPASASANYTVGYGWSGFLSPVNSAPVVNTGKAGKTYPVKWQLTDGNGGFISALSAVSSVTYKATSCAAFSSDSTDALETTSTSAAGLRYDSTANQFIYNWAAPSKSGCYTLFVKLDSSQTFTAFFNLK